MTSVLPSKDTGVAGRSASPAVPLFSDVRMTLLGIGALVAFLVVVLATTFLAPRPEPALELIVGELVTGGAVTIVLFARARVREKPRSPA